ncbi:MAG TPA: hypothetical protein VGX48_18095 [Pyrinomonadaceae bacterium]|jgi:hypothetical protein|nr:hypothetical protein [Pyrinomonadaceae bacterium]
MHRHLIALSLSFILPQLAVAQTARDRELAARFAPTFHQGLGDHPRADYITNFDFDGDWRGDNNWAHADDPRFALRAYVYYAVSETATHYFIHYALFHPRDYKGGGLRGPLLSEAIREGVRRGGKYDPTGLSAEAVLAHENDMEGCLVVVEKGGAGGRPARVTMVETLSHDRFLKYVTEHEPRTGFGRVALQDGRPQLYVEPKGHGVNALAPDDKQPRAGETLTYQFAGQAGNPEQAKDGRTGYDLLPLIRTLWPRARKGVGLTYGAPQTFQLAPAAATGRKLNVTAGSAFLGKVGAPNMARPPWGWFDREERGAAPGEWFFDPAKTIKRHFTLGDDFGTRYLHAPFLGIKRK